MASRNLNDCISPLQIAYKLALAEWERKYPSLPKPFLTCTHRSNEEQTELYAIGRTKPGKKITNAKAGASLHNQMPSRALDIAFIRLDKKLDWSPDLFAKFAELIKAHGVEWGGDWRFKDLPHFQM